MNEITSSIDRKTTNNKGKISKPVNSFKTMCKSNNLIDMWRELNPKKIQYTWRRHNFSQASRIDMFLINKDFVLNIKSCDIRPALIKYTDHQAVSLKIQSAASQSKGPGFWKLNNSVLSEDSYINMIEKIISKYTKMIDKNNSTVDLLWDMLKREIKDASVQYCKFRSKNKKEEIKKLEKELSNLNNKYSETENIDLLSGIAEIEKQLEKEYEYKAKGAQIRSKQEWVEKGEKNTAYFFWIRKV